jgi:hypothetical protein
LNKQYGWKTAKLRRINTLIYLAKLKYLFGYPSEDYIQHIREFVLHKNNLIEISTQEDAMARDVPIAEDVLNPYKEYERVNGMLTPYGVVYTLSFALILNDKKLLTSLLSFPEWKYPFDNGGIIYMHGYVEYFRALKCMCAQEYNKASALLEMFFSITNSRKWKKSEEYSKLYMGRRAVILQAIIQKNQKVFNTSMADIIEMSRKLTQGTMPIEILFMEDALAYCRLAQQNAMEPVDSIYIPKELLL